MIIVKNHDETLSLMSIKELTGTKSRHYWYFCPLVSQSEFKVGNVNNVIHNKWYITPDKRIIHNLGSIVTSDTVVNVIVFSDIFNLSQDRGSWTSGPTAITNTKLDGVPQPVKQTDRGDIGVLTLVK